MEEKSSPEERPPLVPGLTEPRAAAPERWPIRTRESGITRSGWRLTVESVEGMGSIVVVEADDLTHYRGEGVFLGWARERLEAAYQALLAERDAGEERPIFGQLG
jgi:hypothetical protein